MQLLKASVKEGFCEIRIYIGQNYDYLSEV